MRPPVNATFWRQATNGSAYWRGEIPMRYLPGQVLSLETSDLRPDGRNQPWFPRQEGVAIWQYPGNSIRALMMRGMRQRGFGVLAEVDDNYLCSPPYDPGIWKATRKEATHGEHSYQAHRLIVQHECDGLIVATDALARAYEGLAPRIYVCPNSVDPVDWGVGVRTEEPRPAFRIGWTASSSHEHDAALIRRAFAWASKQRGVEVVLFGLRPADWKFKLTHVPWTHSIAEYRQSLYGLDVGVCPLQDNRWNAGKSDIKAMEYAMAGAMPIVSASEPYTAWQQFVPRCADAGDWEKVIRWAVLNRDAVAATAATAREYVLRERTIQQNIWKWREAVSMSAAPST